MYLVDSNIWIEMLLEQDRAQEATMFLHRTSSDFLHITDFAFHSIALALLRRNLMDRLLAFIKDTLIDGGVHRTALEPTDIPMVVGAMREFGLDYDDAYQYVAADKYGLTIISFDADFDGTRLGRTLPANAI